MENGWLEYAGNFIDAIKRVGSSVMAFDWQQLANVWGSIDGWFLEKTGAHVIDAFKAIGHFIVWFLELVLSLFKWILSLIEGYKPS